jgi:hypothetical protein
MITWLTGAQSADYAHLTTEALAAGLPRVEQPDRPRLGHHAAGFRFAGMPGGLAILRRELNDAGSSGQLLSLVVAEPLRRLGLGRDLLGWVCQQGQQLGWVGLGLSYPLDHHGTTAMEKLTSRDAGWVHSPGLQLVQLNRDGAQQLLLQLKPAVQRCMRSGRFRISPWRACPDGIRNGIGPRLAAPPWAWPRDDHGNDPLQALDAEISQVLLDHQEPAGWITAHRVGPRLFRVSQWWVQPRLQGSGVSLLLLHRAIEGALQSPHRYAIGTFGMEPANTEAIRLCDRTIAPFASGISRQRRAWLKLQTTPPG